MFQVSVRLCESKAQSAATLRTGLSPVGNALVQTVLCFTGKSDAGPRRLPAPQHRVPGPQQMPGGATWDIHAFILYLL